MSLWNCEMLRVGGIVKAFVEVQDDYTGRTVGGIRTVRHEGINHYIIVEGTKVDVTDMYYALIDREKETKEALDFKRKYGGGLL